jgi:hypothetical protein
MRRGAPSQQTQIVITLRVRRDHAAMLGLQRYGERIMRMARIIIEVLARGTPMIIIDPIPGQEEWNADFVVAAGAGIQLRMPESVPPAALYLLTQPERLVGMRAAARQFGRPRAALEIAERVLAELQC